MLTRWADWFAWGSTFPVLQIAGDLVVLTPFFLDCLILWLIAYPLELRFRALSEPGYTENAPRWSLGAYLDFNIRHHLLVVCVPMTIILSASDITRGYEAQIRVWTGSVWAPDVLLCVAAAIVFVTAPLMLRHIWRTSPLPAGPLRERLEQLCRRIDLRCRDILVWKSDGLMINAAVMGVAPRVRYVLLSDALLATMTPRQVEAVFGHEAGHVRHRHIQHFLVFALVGWMIVSAMMELLARTSTGGGGTWSVSFMTVEAVGIMATVLVWGLGFGWVSRRFERQADLFGARCVTPEVSDCDRPCSVHPDEATTLTVDGRVCATAAAVFASALHRVAVLNGIPTRERSWRHSSIGSRIGFLAALSADPGLAARFERTVRRIKSAMLSAALLGGAASAYYWFSIPQMALLQLQASALR
jgi:STE24 endopeptidase